MIVKYDHFPTYASFILEYKIDPLVADVIQRSKKANLPVLKLLSHLSEDELFQVSKKGFIEDVLSPVIAGTPFDPFLKKLDEWKRNMLSVPKEKLEVLDVTNIQNLRKACLVSYIRFFDKEALDVISLFEEIDHFFSTCIDLGLSAYEEIQRGELKEKNKILNGLLSNLPVIVTQLDRNGSILKSIGSGVTRLGLKENETIGYDFLSTNPSHAAHILKAYEGFPVSYIGTWEYDGRTYFYENYFFLEDVDQKRLLGFSLDITERVESQEKLFETKKLEEQRVALNNLFAQVPALMGVLKGEEGIVELFNPAFSTLWGHREVIGKTMREAWPELEGQGYFELVEEVYKTGKTVSKTEYPAKIDRHNNGALEEAYFNFVYQPYYSTLGKIDGVLIFGTEVTTHVQDRQRIQESEERFRNIADEAPAFIFLAGSSANVEFLNKTWLVFTGMSLEEAKGGGSLKATHPDDVEHVIATFNTSFEKQQPYTLEIRQKTSKGNYSWVLWKGIPRYLPSGEFVGMMGIGIDINERVQAERALRQSQERLQLALKAGKIGIWSWNITTDTASYSQELHELIGVKNNDYQQFGNAFQTFMQLIHVEDRERVLSEVKKAFQITGLEFYVEFRMIRQDSGDTIWVSERGEVFYDEAHQPVRMTGTIVDITQIKSIEENLKAKNEELVRINADLDNFIYTASHDLRAPISNIEGLIASLPEVVADQTIQNPDFREIMSYIEISINRFKNTIHELTDISKVQRNVSDDESEVDLEKVIDDVEISLREDIQKTSTTIEVNCKEFKTLRFSTRNIRSILYNLISNGIKYRSPERLPYIKIETTGSSEYLILSVSDNGLGIPSHKIGDVFGMFKRLHNHVEGTGVGLYIVKRIVENNQGKIEVDSEMDKGSTFKIYFKKN